MYLILANGFWGFARREWGRIIDRDLSSGDAFVDYIIRIEGLPEDFLKPVGVTWHEKYFCLTCNKPVPEYEIERKDGCFHHKLKREGQPRDEYETSVYEKYSIPKKSWLNPCFRIWFDNEQGAEKFRQIWRFVQMNHPANLPLEMPKAVGNRREWKIDPENVPTIYINGKNPTVVDSAKQDTKTVNKEVPQDIIKQKQTRQHKIVTCPICKKQYRGNGALTLHKMKAHKE